MSKFNPGQSFADGDTVTGAKLNNITGLLNIYTGLISEQAAMTATVSTADQLLIADTDNGDSGAANRVTVQKLLNDTLTNGTYTNAQLSGNLNVVQLSTFGTLNSTKGTIGNFSTTLAGDFTISQGTGTLGTTGVTLGTYGSSTSIPRITIDSKGRITSATSFTPIADSIIYTPLGTGAVARTLASKLSDAVSVKDFGAVGDGVTNDTAAIQAAINSGATSIEISNGTYLVTGLTVASQCTIYGNGVLVKGTASSTPLISITTSNVTIDGLTLKGASYNATPTTRVVGDSGIYSSSGTSVSPYTNLVVSNLIVNGFSDMGIRIQFAQDIKVQNNQVLYCGYAGIIFLSVLRGFIDGNNIKEINSSAGAVNWYGISLTRDPSVTSTASIPCTQCTVSNNIITNVPQWTGIDTHAPLQCLIIGNNVSGCKNGIYAQYDSSSATYLMAAKQTVISNNIVTGPSIASNSVIGIASLGLAATPNDGIYITENTVIACGDYASALGAVHISNSINSKATDNNILRSVRMGISITGTCSYVNLSRNVIDGVQAGSSSASYAYLQLANLTNCSFTENRMRNTSGSGTFTVAQGIIYDGTTPSTGIVLFKNRMDAITNKLSKISGSSNIYTDLSWQLETESCAAFTHVCTGGALIEATASQSSNFRRSPNTDGTYIARPKTVFEPGTAAARKLGTTANYGSLYIIGVYSLDGVTNIVASTSVPNIVLSIDGIYWVD
jgi:hypothetical protein